MPAGFAPGRIRFVHRKVDSEAPVHVFTGNVFDLLKGPFSRALTGLLLAPESQGRVR